ncbi:ATP-binding protein [Pseudooceanicola sp. MF1-13]|uniref:hybrid sensor histidine kinase/response regulator n=1 Tax=Pseudooceanicola sp. MF1-13 TaxID=3379095 RepID=UPI0038925FFC
MLGVLFLLSAVVVAYLLTDVRAKMAELESSPQDNVQWTLTQLEVEYLTLMILAERVDAQNKSDPIPPDVRELRRKYDILYSRVNTIREGSLYDPAVSGGDIEDDFTEIANTIFALAPQIDQNDAALLADLPELKATLDALHPQIRRILTIGNRGLARSEDAARQDVSDVLIRVAAATTVLLVTLLAMTLLFRREAATSDKRLRENLATSARLEAIFSTSRDAILVMNQGGKILRMNDAGEMMFSHGEGGPPDQVAQLLAYNDDQTPVQGKHLFDAAASGAHTRLRMTGRRGDGARFPVELTVGTSTLPELPICVAVVRDITHLVQAEEDLKTSRDKARAGERAKARFLGVISHEMRTPLNGILGAIDLIEDGRDTPDDTLDEYLPVLRNASQSLLNLVEDVLDLTQIEDGLKLSPRVFDLDALLTEIVLTLRPSAQQAGNTLNLSTAGSLGYVTGDPDRLRQIIGNLIANAIKFTTDGDITLDVSRGLGATVEIQVMDTGLGMTEAELAHAFDDFYRTDEAIDHQIKGTGLGLGIARTLAKAMGGEIGAESEKGEGSVFWLAVPLPRAAQPDHRSKSDPRPDVPSARILLVEDNATNRLIARRLLENDGHHVQEATNGQVSLDHCGQEAFDLILMDVSMPVMDGPTAARRIRQTDGPNQSTRIVALTAHLAEGLDNEEMQETFDAVLHKPMNRALLNDQIALALGVAPAQAAPSAADPLASLPEATRQKLTNAFVAEADRDLPDLMQQATQGPDAPHAPLADALHQLAGASASIGLLSLHKILINAEEQERSGDRSAVTQGITQALNDWPEMRNRLIGDVTPQDALHG